MRMGAIDRPKKRSRRYAARLRRDGITARLSRSFNFLTIRGLRDHETAAARVVPIDEFRTLSSTDCCCLSCSTASTPPVAPFSMNNGAVRVRRLSRNRHGAASPPSSKPYASFGCPRASNEARSRVAQAGKGVLVPLTIVVVREAKSAA